MESSDLDWVDGQRSIHPHSSAAKKIRQRLEDEWFAGPAGIASKANFEAERNNLIALGLAAPRSGATV